MGLMLDVQPSLGPALVVGGGAVAARKVQSLAEAGFDITVVAPEIAESIRTAPRTGLIEREWREEDIEGHALVFACTGSRAVNRAVGEASRNRGLPVLVADRQDESTFFSPAVLRDGDVAVAVSSGGASPELASDLRTRIAMALGAGWGRVAEAARLERKARLQRERAEEEPKL